VLLLKLPDAWGDLEGRRFGRLIALGYSGSKTRSGQKNITCVCNCGNYRHVAPTSLRRGATTSCGCRRSEVCAARNVAGSKHGDSSNGRVTPEYGAWQSMKSRCLKPNDRRFKWYGARGITVHSPWIDSFEAFLRDVGRRPSRLFSLERRNNNGNYEPGNVCWATSKEQGRNQRQTRWYELNGERKPLGQWCEDYGIPYAVVQQRIDRFGWSLLRALTVPKGERPSVEKPERTRLFPVWLMMVGRCHDPKHRRFKDYGARGISVCQRWRESFADFYEDIIAGIGPRPSKQYSIDRIEGSLGYEPDNIRWATWTEQNRNRRNTRLYVLYGQERTLAEWSDLAGMPYLRVKQRVLTYKWPLEEALGTPVGGSGRMSREDRRSWCPSD
jgi:hypothetical protein